MAEACARPGPAQGRAAPDDAPDPPCRVCWADLAATDAARAADFYAALFGWQWREERVGDGVFTRLSQAGVPIGSLYQLSDGQRRAGVPSHWTPYVQVPCVDDVADRAATLGGVVLVRPFDVPGYARIGVILDPVGAQLGLWERHQGP